MVGFLRRLGSAFAPWRAQQRTSKPAQGAPTVFHITHLKSGSQWIHRIFLELAHDRFIQPEDQNVQFLAKPVVPGAVYPTLYVTREQFDSVATPADARRFVVVRDLRDTLVSAYFSLKYTHPVMHNRLQSRRQLLSALSEEEGFLHLIESWLAMTAQIQWSWVAAGEKLIRYEDLLVRDVEILEPLLLDHCRLPVARERVREVILANRFENVTKGRARGNEDRGSHERKGIGGDWKHHFTDAIKKEFKRQYGSVLIATGYEKDFNW